MENCDRPILALDGVRAAYGKTPVLIDVSCRLCVGQIVAVFGGNGAGKSTLLKAVSGLKGISSGVILLEGEDISSLPAHERVRRGITHVPQGSETFLSMSVEENLLLGGFIATDRAVLRARLDQAFSLFPVLYEKRKGLAGALSGGQRQMLAIARGLMSGPRVMLLDEPSGGLSPVLVDDVSRTISLLRTELHMAIILVEQRTPYASRLADQVLVLDRGSVAFHGEASSAGWQEALLSTQLGPGKRSTSKPLAV